MKGKNKDQNTSKQTTPLPIKQELSFPDVSPLDHSKMCPRYTSGKKIEIFFDIILIFSQIFDSINFSN